LEFSPSGAYLYSGGGEGVLVRWAMDATGEKNMLPRLGVAIKHITCESKNQSIAIAHEDNSINFTPNDLSRDDRVAINAMISTSDVNCHEISDIAYHSLSNSLIMNAFHGYLQFYSQDLQQLLYRIDIVQRNYLPDVGVNSKIYEVELTKFACSPDGKWLAVVEMRDDTVTSIELRLKFFRAIDTKQKFELNTTAHCAHRDKIVALQFAPNSQVLVTASVDRLFKLWTLEVEDRGEGEEPKRFWSCAKVGSRNSVARPRLIAFSNDSSLLSVVFDNVVTFWDTTHSENLVFKETVLALAAASVDESLLVGVHFCQNVATSHLFIEVREKSVKVWNLLNLTVQYSRNFSTAIARTVFDPIMDRLALIATDHKLTVWPISLTAELYNVHLTDLMMGAVYVPIADGSRLIYLNEKRELRTIVDADLAENLTNDIHLLREAEETKQTPFTKMLIDAKRNELLTGLKETTGSYGKFLSKYINSTKVAEEMFLNVPSHVLPPIDKICDQFLDALLGDDDIEQ